jgi:threonine dehydratase
VLRTPLRRSSWLSDLAGGEVLLKLETLQPTFSYKIRGAFNVVARLQAGQAPHRPLVTASAGNHGRALAHAASAARLPLTVYVPDKAPRSKLEAIRALGVDMRTCRDYDEAERQAKQHAARGDASWISPYSHPDVIAGAGTVGLEILSERPDLDAIVVPVGGGGLVSGIAVAAAAMTPATRVIGVEVEASQPFARSRAAGRIVPVEVGNTLADGLAGNLDPDTVTFDIVERLVGQLVTVGEAHLRRAMRGVVERERLVAEGAGAVGVAALLASKGLAAGQRVAIVLSGANVDSAVLGAVLNEES